MDITLSDKAQRLHHKVPMLRNLKHLPGGDTGTPKKPVPPCGCDKDPVEGLKQLFVDYAQGKALANGRDPATRPVFLRLHGVAFGTFAVCPDLPADLRVGVFGQKPEYPVWVRFSGDIQPGIPDLKGTAGVGIKLFGVEGEKLLPPDQDATTHDFLLQNHDVFFVDTAKEMCDFTCLSINGQFDEYVKAHPMTGEILNDMEKVVDTVLGTPYWSGLPSRFGKDRYVKYKLEPETVPGGVGQPDYTDPFYLRTDLIARLKHGEARIKFLVQFQTNDKEMPLDRATIRWSEQSSVPVHVATLILPRQDITVRGQSEYGENLAFNTWHALPEHEPVGSIAAARKVVYRASADIRRNFNATPLGEPTGPRPAEWKPDVPYPPGKDTRVVRAAIHPAIGVARVGNSPNDYFIGPEVTDPAPNKWSPGEPSFYRDCCGALKRQVAQFRIYGYNCAGEVVSELTADTADIRWTVHVANRKADWYQWTMALDIPEAAGSKLPRRNANVIGDQRRQLVIDPGSKSIQGKSTSGSDYELWGAFFRDTPNCANVYLGELRTDDAGRLRFFGGRGISASPIGSSIFNEDDPNGFINADGWYDDISDGPVTAEVTIEGRLIPVEPAWVLTAPPNYGPNLHGVRTLYDLLYDLYVQAGWLDQPPTVVSFRDDVYPILRRLSNLQWVNRGFATQFGYKSPNDFTDPVYVAKLACVPRPGEVDIYKELRRQVLHSFRDPNGTDNNQSPWPWIYGDAMAVPPANTPRQNAAISLTQYRILQAWAGGMFISYRGDPGDLPDTFEKVKLQDQPAMLDRAALTFCLADAFHPGCEVTWPIRHLTMFHEPFRIRHRPVEESEPDYGKMLTPEIALSPSGPLHAQGPGDLTQWMGLPWQADTGFCRSGYDKDYDPFVPTFWPARVPNQVLTDPNYKIVIDPNEPRDHRLRAFTDRMSWTKPLQGSTAGMMEQMVRIFGDMGLVEVRDGVANDPDFPATMMVASFGPAIRPPAPPDGVAPIAPPGVPPMHPGRALSEQALRAAGWESDEQREKAPLPVRHPGQK